MNASQRRKAYRALPHEGETVLYRGELFNVVWTPKRFAPHSVMIEDARGFRMWASTKYIKRVNK